MRAGEKSRRIGGRRVKKVFINAQPGDQIKAVRLSDDRVQPTTTPALPETTARVADSRSASTAYTAEQIRQAGGIDALSAIIGNNKPIKISAIDFTEAEWAQMTTDMADDQ